MMEDESKKSDLKEVFQHIYLIFKKNFIVFLLIFIIINSYGVYNVFFSGDKYVYTNSIIFNSRFLKLNKSEIRLQGSALEAINTLSTYIDNKDLSGLSEVLDVDESILYSVESLKTIPFMEPSNGFEIELISYNSKIHTDLMNSIINHLNQSSFVKLNRSLINSRDSLMLVNLKEEISSMKAVIKNSINSDCSLENLGDMYAQLLVSVKEKNNIEYQSKLGQTFYIFDKSNFVVIEKKYTLGVLKYFAYSLFLSAIYVVFINAISTISNTTRPNKILQQHHPHNKA